jgi:putative transposase
MDGVRLVGPDGLLAGVTKAVLETALQTELSEHLGYEKGDPAGRGAANSRNGATSKTVHTDLGPVRIEVPRDRAGSFEPKVVRRSLPTLVDPAGLVEVLGASGAEIGRIVPWSLVG